MALKEYSENDYENSKPVYEKQAEEKLGCSVQGIRTLYINDEPDSEYSSQLSKDDWDMLKVSLKNPEYNKNLADLLNTESVFD